MKCGKMSKKTFFRISWKEILVLLVIDFFVLASLVYLYVSSCLLRLYECTFQGPCPYSTSLSCTLEFFTDRQNFVWIFVIGLVVNFALSALWHFVVKK